VILLLEQFDIEVVAGEPGSGKCAWERVRDIFLKVRRKSWFGCAFLLCRLDLSQGWKYVMNC